MTLFREMPEANRDKFVAISLKHQRVMRNALRDAGSRAQAFLMSVLLIGSVLVSLLMYLRTPTRSMTVALGCFLGGLLFLGVLNALNFELSRALLVRATNRLNQIFRNQVPVELGDTPPISLRWTYVASGAGYLAFLLWIIGTATAFEGFTWPVAATVSQTTASNFSTQPSTMAATPEAEPQKNSSLATLPKQEAHLIAATAEAERARWSTSDTVALSSGVVAFLQFIALIATWYVMRSTARRQLRAYALPNSFFLSEGGSVNPPNPSKVNEPGVVVEMKNFGQTPAYRLVSWASIDVLEPINEDKLVVPPLAQVSSQTLPTNGITTKTLWFNRALTPTEISDVQKMIRLIYVHGRIEYFDVYGSHRYSNFRVVYGGQWPPKDAVLSFRDKGNESN